MNIVIDPALQAYIDPLTPDEHAALERSLLAEGCRDALVLWGDVLVDGHNRHGLCIKHGLPFQTMQHPQLHSLEDVHLWMIDQHLGRRSVSDFQRGLLALRKREILEARAAAALAEPAAPAAQAAAEATPVPAAEPLRSREALAKAARLSSSQVQMIEKIQKQAAPEVVQAVRAGTISINAAATVASLPPEAQAEAAAAGPKALKEAARQVRETRRKPAADGVAPAAPAAASDAGSTDAPAGELAALRAQVLALQAENSRLRAQLQALGLAPAEPMPPWQAD